MTLINTPLRLLVKSYANGLLDRQQYLEIRLQVLKKLASSGKISHDDLQNFMQIYQDTGNPKILNSYSVSDWLIIILGMFAASALAYIFLS